MSLAERAKAIADKSRGEAQGKRISNRERMPATGELLNDIKSKMNEYCRLDPRAVAWFRFTENGLTLEWGEHVPDAWVKK